MWQAKTAEEVTRQVAAAQLQSTATSRFNSAVPVQQNPLTHAEIQMHAERQAQAHRTRMFIINNMGGSDPDERRRKAQKHLWDP